MAPYKAKTHTMGRVHGLVQVFRDSYDAHGGTVWAILCGLFCPCRAFAAENRRKLLHLQLGNGELASAQRYGCKTAIETSSKAIQT